MTDKRKKMLDNILAEANRMVIEKTWPVTEDELVEHPGIGSSFEFGFLCGFLHRDEDKEEPESEELEEAARKYLKQLNDSCFVDSDILRAFKAGAQWQKQKDSISSKDMFVGDDIQQAFDKWVQSRKGKAIYARDSFKAGMEYMKQQVMKDAVEITVVVSGEMPAVAFGLPGTNLKDGDKVKVYLFKED